MIHYINYIKDTLGNNYLGVKIEPGVIEPFQKELKDIIGEDDYKVFTENQQKRDHGQFHITVINTTDYNKCCKEFGIDKFVNSLESVFSYEIDDIKMMGIGTATKNENRCYFIVCKSEKLQAIRKRYNLPEHDFHITLGFKWKDVHGVRKNQVLEKNNKFLKLLKQEFYNNHDWNFIKKIKNFDLDPKSEIIPIEINETHLKVKCSGHYLDIGYLEDGEKFWVVAKYSIDIDRPRLPETEIAKILNQK